MTELALGIKPRTGWAIAVVVTGSSAAPVVLERRRLTLCPDTLPRQVYHAAQALPRAEAGRLVEEVDTAVTAASDVALSEVIDAAQDHGEVVTVGLVGRPRDLPDLDTALANHTMLHAAEGELYRGALDDAAGRRDLPVVPLAPKRTIEEAAVALGTTRDALTARLAGLRGQLGAPWQSDHKDATAAALVALSSR